MLSLLLPHLCIHCSQPAAVDAVQKATDPLASYLCPRCLQFLMKASGPSMEQSLELISRTGTEASFDFAFSAASFLRESPIQSIVHSFKYDEMPRLAEHIGRAMGERCPDLKTKFDLLLPVPLHRTRFAERGYNQAELLSHGIAEVLGIAVVPRKTVQRIRPTPTQTALDVHERLENVRGAFGVSTRHATMLRSRSILIVDDVMTTGATISSLAEALLPCKPAALGFATFATVD